MEDMSDSDPYSYHPCENYCLSCAAEFKSSNGGVQTEKITYFGVTADSGQEDCEFISVSSALNFIFQFPPSNHIDEMYEKRLGCCPVCSGVIGQLFGLHKQLQALNNSKSMLSSTMKSALESVALKSVVPIRTSVIVPDSHSQYSSKRLCVESRAEDGIFPKMESPEENQNEAVEGLIQYGIPVELQSVNSVNSEPRNSFPRIVNTESLARSQPELSPDSLSEVPESIVEAVYILPENREIGEEEESLPLHIEEEDDLDLSKVRKTRASAWEESQLPVGVCYEVCPECGLGVEQEKDRRGLERHIALYHNGARKASDEQEVTVSVPSEGNNGHDTHLTNSTYRSDQVKLTKNGKAKRVIQKDPPIN